MEAGKEVYLNPHTDGTLVLQKARDGRDNLASVTIDLNSWNADVAIQHLVNAYRAGYESVNLVASDTLNTEVLDQIESSVTDLIGMELTKSSDTEITVRCLMDPSDVSIRQSVVQLEFITSVTLESATSVILGESNDLGQIRSREREANRICVMIDRHFTRSLIDLGEIDKLNLNRLQLFRFYVGAQRLRRITGLGASVATMIHDSPGESHDGFPDELQSIIERSTVVVEHATQALMETESEGRALEALELYGDVIDEIESIQNKESIVDVDRMDLFLRVIDKFVQMLEASLEVTGIALQEDYYMTNE